MTRGMVRMVMRVMESTARCVDWCRGKRIDGSLRLKEVRIPVLDPKYAMGIVQPVEGERLGFWLTNECATGEPKRIRQPRPVYKRHRTLSSEEEDLEETGVDTDSSDTSDSAPHLNRKPVAKRRVYLFLAGGGYVTGWPLVHPFIFSLARTFAPSSGHHLPRQAIFAPDIRKSLSVENAFPTPLVDALAAYTYLLAIGYTPGEIVLMGDSAGGGLVWSLLAYLCIASREGKLGPPGGVIMISPWLSLPPTTPTPMPDFLDEPQLLNAARSYLARFPILPARADPFSSEMSIWIAAISEKFANVASVLRGKGVMQRVAQAELHPQSDPLIKDLAQWLEPASFARTTSHHPLLSPCSDLDSPFVTAVLAIAARHTRMLIVSGTAEWFHAPAQQMASAAVMAGADVEVVHEMGGFHCESCLFLAEWDGPGRRLVDAIRQWIV
jgi:acetyl esterase/lipase